MRNVSDFHRTSEDLTELGVELPSGAKDKFLCPVFLKHVDIKEIKNHLVAVGKITYEEHVLLQLKREV